MIPIPPRKNLDSSQFLTPSGKRTRTAREDPIEEKEVMSLFQEDCIFGLITSEPLNIFIKMLLRAANIWNPQNKKILFEHNNLQILTNVLVDFSSVEMLTQENFDAVAARPDIESLAKIISRLYHSQSLTQTTFEMILHQNDDDL